MAHKGDRVGVEIEVSFRAKEGGVVGGREDERLGSLIVSGYHVGSAEAEGLCLAIEGHEVRGVILRDESAL